MKTHFKGGHTRDKGFFLILFLLSFQSMLSLYAQRRSVSDNLIFRLSEDTLHQKEVGYFYRTQSPLFNDPEPPRFIITGRDNKFLIGIGGFVALRSFYDLSNSINSIDFNTFDIPVADDAQDKRWGLEASSSRLFLKIIGISKLNKPITGYVEVDFRGDNRVLRLRQAYVSIAGFTLGQTYSNFIDIYSFAPALDFNGNIVSSFLRNPMIRYEYESKCGISFGLSLERGEYSGKYLNQTASAHDEVPDVNGYVQYKWRSGHIRYSGTFREMTYKNEVRDHYRNSLGLAAKFSGKFTTSPYADLFFHIASGKGIASYIVASENNELDLLPDPLRPGIMFSPKGMVGYAAAKVNYTPKIYSGFTFSYNRFFVSSRFLATEQYRELDLFHRSMAISGNVIWEFIPFGICGIEYWIGKRCDYGGKEGITNRIYAMIRYNF